VLAELSQRHAIFVADLASAVRSSHKFATNGNAFCASSPLASSAGSLPALKSAIRAEYAKVHARVLAIRSTSVNGNPAVKAEFTISSTAGMTVSETQYEVLSESSRLCTVTLSTDNPGAFRQIFNKIGGTVNAS
jgi:hypothetical protein